MRRLGQVVKLHDISFVRLTDSGARFLIERGVRLVGIDYLSIGDAEAHQELLGARVIALEGLDLREVDSATTSSSVCRCDSRAPTGRPPA
jgi:kynurenine formamidase